MAILFAVLLLNIYPVETVQTLLVSAKKNELQERALTISTALQNVNYSNFELVAEALSRVVLASNETIIITDKNGRIIYNTDMSYAVDSIKEFEDDVKSALLEFDVFRCTYDANVFISSMTMPIINSRVVQGALHLAQADTESPKLLKTTRNSIFGISVFFAIFGGILILVIMRMLSKRFTALLDGVAKVGQGEYSYKIRIKSDDEFAQIAEEFNQMSGKLQAVENTRRAFVSDASHELKTPLASIKLLSDSIIQTENISRQETVEFLQDINDEIERLIRITENLLYLTKIDATPLPAKSVCNVSKIAMRCVEVLTANAKHSNVELKVHTKDDCRVFADSDALHQIIFNLVENAVKYNKESGKVNILIKKEEERCIVEVNDTGIGIPNDEISKIFDRFYRVDKARARATGGSGLGLSIVRDSVEKLGGTIKVQSTADVGTTFTLSLPLAQ